MSTVSVGQTQSRDLLTLVSAVTHSSVCLNRSDVISDMNGKGQEEVPESCGLRWHRGYLRMAGIVAS